MASGPLRGAHPWDIRILLCTHPRGIRVSLGAHRHGIRAPWGPITVLSEHLGDYGDSFPMAQGRPQKGPSPQPQGALGRRMEPILVAPGHLMVLVASGCHGTEVRALWVSLHLEGPISIASGHPGVLVPIVPGYPRAPSGPIPVVFGCLWVPIPTALGCLWAHIPVAPGHSHGCSRAPRVRSASAICWQRRPLVPGAARARLHTRVCTPALPQHTGHARCQLCRFICPLRCREVAAAHLSCCSVWSGREKWLSGVRHAGALVTQHLGIPTPQCPSTLIPGHPDTPAPRHPGTATSQHPSALAP